jgi:PAS domain S-box-containing protein
MNMHHLTERMARFPKSRVLALCFGAVLLVSYIDWLTIPAASFPLFLILVVALAVYALGLRAGLWVTGISVLTLAAVEWRHPNSPWQLWITAWNSAVRLAVFLLTVFLVHTVRRLNEELDERVRQRTAQLEQEVRRCAQTELQLNQSIDQFRRLLESAPDGIVIVNQAHEITLVNPRAESMFGYTHEELLGKSVDELVPGRFRAEHVHHRARFMGDKRARPMGGAQDLHGVRKDGTEFAVDISLSPLDAESGTLVIAVIRDVSERKAAETRLRDSEERFRQLAENIQEVFWMSDPAKNRMIYISPGYERIWGRPCDSLYNSPRSWAEAVHPEDRERVLSAALTKQVSGQYSEIYRILRPDGSIRWIQDRAFPVRDPAGEIYRIVGIAGDITARKQTEAQLTMLAQALQSSSELICITDMQDRFIYANRAFQQAVGYSETEILGRTPDILFSPNNPPTLMAEILRQSHLGGWRGEVLDRRKDGTEFPIYLSTSQIKDETGHIVGLMGVSQDITERKRTELALRELAAIVEHSEDAIVSVGLDRRVLTWNQGAERIFGYTAAEVIGQWRSPVVPADRTGEMEQIWRAIQEGRGVTNLETERLRKDGTRFEASLTVSPIRNAAGKVIACSAIVRDITERKRLEREILEISANERRRIGHDLHDGLGQFLTGISLQSKALEHVLAEAHSPHAQEAKEITTLVANAIRQTRTLARSFDPIEIESDGLLATALQTLIAGHEDMFGTRCDFNCDNPALRTSPQVGVALYRIAQEAMHNAVKHGQARNIQVGLKTNAEHLCLQIQDDGAGFPTPGEKSDGMGLRLMSYRAGSIGAHLTIQSQPGQGTRIECLVPRAVWAPRTGATAKPK